MAALVAVATSSVVRAQDAIDAGVWRVPFRSPVLALPLTPYSLQRACAELAWAVRMPIGYESPKDQLWQPAPALSEIPTQGRTVADILDDIVSREPRYAWTRQDGVIHVRPTAAVADPTDLLNRPIGQFDITSKTLTEALREVRYVLQPELRGGAIAGSGMAPGVLGRRTFNVRTQSTTVLGVLDAIVKAHGAASWSVTYRREDGQPHAQFSFHAFDGWSITG